MIGSGGRCHGPNCTRPAVIEDGFCSESCQAKWNGQFDEQARRRELNQQALRDNPSLRESAAECFRVLDEAIERTAPHPTQADLDAALAVAARVREESEASRRVVLCSEADEDRVRAAAGSMLLGSFLDVRVSEFAPPGQVIVMNPSALQLGGILAQDDVARVEVEEVDDLPSMAQSGELTPGCDCGHEGSASGWHLSHCRWLADLNAAFPHVAPSEPLAANPQVADNKRRSEVGEPGWLGRAFHWLFGRTT